MKSLIFIKLLAFCLLLLAARVLITGHYSYIFLLWNLFLAWLPYWFINSYSRVQHPAIKSVLIGLTLLFLPNAPYILTDLFHLSNQLTAPMPRWFDLTLILSFSLFGLLFFILSCEKLFAVLEARVKQRFRVNILKYIVMLSNGYGIYLGRYLRFNSWDVVYSPDSLLAHIFRSVFSRGHCKETLGITITFAIFLYLVFEIYESLKKHSAKAQHEIY